MNSSGSAQARTLSFGQDDRREGNDHVEALQRKLKGLGYYLGACDGAFGPELQAAVDRFRAKVMKIADKPPSGGGCDGATWGAIQEASGSTFAEVLCAELNAFRGAETDPPPEATADTAIGTAHAMRLAGLAFSGGGVRSATFNLGIVQALAAAGALRQFHYLSTVSGGGYTGAWLSRWIHAQQGDVRRVEAELKKSVTPGTGEREPREITYLRQYANYLTPRVGLLSADTWALLGTYARNAFLNLLTLSFGLAAVLLLPRLWIALVVQTHAEFGPLYAAAGLAAWLFAVAAVAYGVTRARLPSPRSERGQGWVLRTIVAPYMIAAAAGSVALWTYRDTIAGLWQLPAMGGPGSGAGFLVPLSLPGVLYAAAWLAGWGCARRLNRRHPGQAQALLSPRLLRQGLALFAFGLVAFAVAAALVLASLMWPASRSEALASPYPTYLASAGPPWLLLVIGVATILHIGLVGRAFSDSSREWRSRQGGWIGIAALLWAGLFACSVYMPPVVAWMAEHGPGWVKAAAAAGWAGSIWASLWAARNPASGDPARKGKLNWLALCAPPLVAIALLAMLATLIHVSVGSALHLHADSPRPPLAILHEQMAEVARTPLATLGLAWLVCTAACLGLAARVDVNKFSLYMMYRNRLVKTFLGASRPARDPDPFTGFDGGDDLALNELGGQGGAVQKPYLIVNTTLNLVKGKELAWQARKAASFVFTPRYAGFETPAMPVAQTRHTASESARGLYRPTSAYGLRRADASEGVVKLGMAMAVSGAAASPNMGYHSSPVLSFLMTMFNIRLGRWCGNPASPAGWTWSSPPVGLYYLVRELLGFTDMASNFLYLSDGGHFDNLGIYELVRRRCRLIVCVDASADRLRQFGDLGNAVRKCQTDFNVAIDIDVRRLQEEEAAACCVAGTIHYDGQRKGTLLYIKPALTGREEVGIYNYAKKNPDFPHQSTLDQWFDEAQFESYRALGHHIGATVFSAIDARLSAHALLRTPGDKPAGIDALSEAIEDLYIPAAGRGRPGVHPGTAYAMLRHGRNGLRAATLPKRTRFNGQTTAREPE